MTTIPLPAKAGSTLVVESIDNSGIRAKINDHREKLTRLEDIYIEGNIDKSSYIRRRAALKTKIAELNMSIEKQAGIDELLMVADRIANTMNRLHSADRPTLKNLINMLFERVELVNGTITSLSPRLWARPFFPQNNVRG